MSESVRYYYKEIRLQQFRSLVALARWQTFTAAAAALKLTRASVWQQLRSLEQELACTLLRTRDHRVELTPAGHKLVEIVAPLVEQFDSVKAQLHESIREELPQTLVIATPPSFLIHELREPIARIHAEHPALHLTLLERNSPAAIELLEQGGADLAIAARPESVSAKSALNYIKFAVYPFTLICPPDHPFLTKKKLVLKDFGKHPMILPTSAAYCRQKFNAICKEAGILSSVNVVIESNFPAMLVEYVRLGLGTALTTLPLNPASSGSYDGVILRDVSEMFGEETIYYVRRRGQFETSYAARFRALVTDPAVRAA